MSAAARASVPDRCAALKKLISAHERKTPGYWDFADSPRRGGGHAFFQYPAMMVPELQGALLDDLLRADPAVSHIYDPFMGSGTVLLESIYRGLNFHGVDINPMAALLSHVKSDPPSKPAATTAARAVVARARKTRVAPHEFAGVQKWFKPQVRHELAQLRSAIAEEASLKTRRFLWVCLAETIRMASNSRTSTVKLHVYAADELQARQPQTISMFESIAMANADRAGEHWDRVQLRRRQPVRNGKPTVRIQRASILSDIVGPRSTDAIMSSPPYGDNDTTVPYGQHSYLPLQWIIHDDLIGTTEPGLLASTGRIDTLSLGGSLVGALDARAQVEGKSEALKKFLRTVDARPDLLKKVVSFSRDYEAALERATRPLKVGGFAFWTLGERRVGGNPVPLVRITEEFLALHGLERVMVINRVLPLARKRMAGLNPLGATMSSEHILVTVKTR